MFLLLFVAGLVLLIAGGSWFAEATTVGTILVIVGAFPWIVLLVVFLLGLIGVSVGAGLDRRSRKRRTSIPAPPRRRL